MATDKDDFQPYLYPSVMLGGMISPFSVKVAEAYDHEIGEPAEHPIRSYTFRSNFFEKYDPLVWFISDKVIATEGTSSDWSEFQLLVSQPPIVGPTAHIVAWKFLKLVTCPDNGYGLDISEGDVGTLTDSNFEVAYYRELEPYYDVFPSLMGLMELSHRYFKSNMQRLNLSGWPRGGGFGVVPNWATFVDGDGPSYRFPGATSIASINRLGNSENPHHLKVVQLVNDDDSYSGFITLDCSEISRLWARLYREHALIKDRMYSPRSTGILFDADLARLHLIYKAAEIAFPINAADTNSECTVPSVDVKDRKIVFRGCDISFRRREVDFFVAKKLADSFGKKISNKEFENGYPGDFSPESLKVSITRVKRTLAPHGLTVENRTMKQIS